MTGKAGPPGGRPGSNRSSGGRASGGRPTGGRPISPRSAGSSASSGSLYERYKDALRRGHVAALRGRNDAAIDAYLEAASIAPDRALPHASIGGIFVKMGRLDDAVAAYERALALGPRDESALRGIAEALSRSGRRTEAAAALDRLGEVLDGAGRLADATDAARRALELAESRPRRLQVESFAGRLRAASSGDETAQRALDQALRMLEPARAAKAEAPERVPAAEIEAATEAPAAEPEPETAALEPGSAAATAPDTEPEAEATPEPEPEEPAPEEPEPEPEEPEPDAEPAAELPGLGIALGAAAEAALYAGDITAAHEGLLAAARSHRRAGRLVAAVDACYLAISIAPDDPDLHLLLVEIYLDRGWRSQAADKLLLLGRLADLDANTAVRERLCELVAARLPDEPRVAELCA